ncbi:hypothetical protein [Pseudogemmobacter humi]|uniref:hypothetical protein n=1 Tax=Pseudogemmobacter humi TaxID=2483812 RepID=UPI000F542A81|nr:hypothetical protein [Pseudogemmobacter humi]
MSSIYSSMRRKNRDCLIGAFAVAACLTSVAVAETGTVRIGAHFFPTSGHRYQSLHSVSEIQDQLNSDMQQFVTGFAGCPAIVEGPLDFGKPRDPLRDTSTIIQSIRVWCWAILQTDHAAQVSASGPGAGITTELIHGIMANAQMLAAEDEDWSQTLVTFSGGEITCTDQERCRLSLPDGKDPPEQSVDFELILATGDERFILVTQAIYGRSGFVYGVRWREHQDGGEVISIFPDRL